MVKSLKAPVLSELYHDQFTELLLVLSDLLRISLDFERTSARRHGLIADVCCHLVEIKVTTGAHKIERRRLRDWKGRRMVEAPRIEHCSFPTHMFVHRRCQGQSRLSSSCRRVALLRVDARCAIHVLLL